MVIIVLLLPSYRVFPHTGRKNDSFIALHKLTVTRSSKLFPINYHSNPASYTSVPAITVTS